MQELLLSTFAPGEVFEVRILGATVPGYRQPHTQSGYFRFEEIDSIPEAMAHLVSYTGCYFSLNPVNPAVYARCGGRITAAKRGTTTSDEDILHRHYLFIDIDPKRPAGISATQKEKKSAWNGLEEIKGKLFTRGFPEPITVDSGNGFYLLYRINLPAEDSTTIKNVLRVISTLTDYAIVDPAVHNAARIIRLPGTWNRKGDNTKDRPHRKAKVVSIPDDIIPVDTDLLQQMAAEYAPPPPKKSRKHLPHPGQSRPGDAFNENGNIHDILAPHGWQFVGEMGENQLWRRPDKTEGHSATWNGHTFYVFSSNAEPLEPNRGYSLFSLHAILNHGGDFTAAATAISGKPSDEPLPEIDISEIIKPTVKREQSMEQFLDVPGFIGNLIKYNLSTAHKQQPVLALAGAIALQSILCARKIRTVHGTRPNLMICGVAPSGTGKEHARSLNRQILINAGASHLHAEGLKSGSALVNALTVNPAILFQIDEFGRFIKATRNPERNQYTYEIITKLLTLYTSSGATYETDRYADADKGGVLINCPHVVIYGTTVPQSLYEGLTEESITDGFLARILIFDVGDNNPRRRIVQERPVDSYFVDMARWWNTFRPDGGNLDHSSITVPLTEDAIRIGEEFIDTEHDRMSDIGENPISTLWSRTAQNADKLALLYAASRDHEQIVVDADAAQWGYSLAETLTRQMILSVKENIASNRFHAEVLRAHRSLQKGAKDRRKLMMNLRMKSREVDEILDYMLQSGMAQKIEKDGKTLFKGA